MSTVHYRFFGGLLGTQEKWLNAMAQSGYRLRQTGKIRYEFEPCDPGRYSYRIEWVAQKSRREADDYMRFLQECGYRVLPKNANLNFSIGKIKWRPWADDPLHLATKRTTLGREMLIVEKKRDGRPFELHTQAEDKIAYCKNKRKPWLFLFACAASGGVLMRSVGLGIMGGCLLIPLFWYQRELSMLNKQADIFE